MIHTNPNNAGLCYLVDAIEGVSFAQSDAPTPNFHALYHGVIGLELISRNVWQSEQLLHGSRMVFIYPQTIHEDGIISSYFYWFGVTLVNHARLAGMLVYLHKNQLTDKSLMLNATRKKAVAFVNDYVETLIPDILKWRHKIGAHFAFTAPRNTDTLFDLRQSVMTHALFVRNRWRACGFRHGQSTIPEWSVTEEMERLKDRFWPHFEYVDNPQNPLQPIPDRSKFYSIWSTGGGAGQSVRLID